MNSLKQRSLQVCNWISETQCAKWGCIRKATPASFADGVTLRAILADEYQTSPFRWRLFGESGSTKQNCAPGKKWPSGLDGLSLYHSCALRITNIAQYDFRRTQVRDPNKYPFCRLWLSRAKFAHPAETRLLRRRGCQRDAE